ncbi:hypothetical protein GALMADRAFT_105210 [Galerina marginata CBS 339.88]|uniref:Uncharacterized protein n=1 Tax=Galerina marginata (strain CBS 339.88) TaxID=685588 RepID=A0A067SAN4_GALM3|nr:hypothetical protein GALMADRAFT_105210 [Galerina marginata CBS 339.88]
MLSWTLYGALSVQVYLYYIAFPKDRIHSKLLVYGLFVIETLQSMLIGRDMFLTFAIGFANVSELTNVNHSWFTMPILGGFVASVVQFFYAYRIMVLAKSKFVASLCLKLSIMQCAGALIDGVLSCQAGSFLELTTPLQLVGHGVDILSYYCFWGH